MDGFYLNLDILDLCIILSGYYFKPVTAASFDPDTVGKKYISILLLPSRDGSPVSHLVSAHIQWR